MKCNLKCLCKGSKACHCCIHNEDSEYYKEDAPAIEHKNNKGIFWEL